MSFLPLMSRRGQTTGCVQYHQRQFRRPIQYFRLPIPSPFLNICLVMKSYPNDLSLYNRIYLHLQNPSLMVSPHQRLSLARCPRKSRLLTFLLHASTTRRSPILYLKK